MKKFSAIIILIWAAVILNISLLPWKTWVHQAIQAMLADGNIKAEFTVERVDPGFLVLTNISVQDVPMAFELLDIRYSPKAFFDKKLVIYSAILRSKDGEISTKDISLDLSKPNEATAVLDVKNVPLGMLMKLLTGGKADATGMVSGKLPVTLHEDGSFSFNHSTLSASQGGTITMAPELIPGDNEQVAMVREIMQNFHYNQFSMQFGSDQDKKLSILLSLSGNNPDVYNGREVKLNVNLTGDVLPLLQQSVMPIADPKQFLEQKQ